MFTRAAGNNFNLGSFLFFLFLAGGGGGGELSREKYGCENKSQKFGSVGGRNWAFRASLTPSLTL